MNRPTITAYAELAPYLRDMLEYRKATETGFSVLRATRSLRRVSPTLVSLVLQGKRKLSLDRVDEFARLLALNSAEKSFLRSWLERDAGHARGQGESSDPHVHSVRVRKDVSTSLLNDWINVYVKDFFMFPAVQKDPELIERFFAPVANPKRVQRSIDFLLREGHLRKTLNGHIVIDTRLSVADPGVPSRKIRQFHKAALKLAREALDLYPPSERLANTLTLPLDEKRHQELCELLGDFAEKLKEFAAQNPDQGDRLYQIIVNLSPIGGKAV